MDGVTAHSPLHSTKSNSSPVEKWCLITYCSKRLHRYSQCRIIHVAGAANVANLRPQMDLVGYSIVQLPLGKQAAQNLRSDLQKNLR